MNKSYYPSYFCLNVFIRVNIYPAYESKDDVISLKVT